MYRTVQARARRAAIVWLAALSGVFATGAPVFAAGEGTAAGLTISPRAVVSGTSAQGTLTLTAAVADATVVGLQSTDTTVLTVPASVTVPAGATSAVFTITTRAFDGPGTFACVNATAGVTVTDCLTINPAPSGPALKSVTFSPGTVVGGGGDTGTASFTAAPSGGRVVQLTSSDPAVASVPSETTVIDGTAGSAFAVTTTAVTSTTTVTVTATADGITATGTLTLTPGTPPPADTVRVTKARWNRGILQIQATSTNPDAILSVFGTASDSFMFTLTNIGGGRYQDQRQWLDNPLSVTIKSNFGGQATASVGS
jgi:hypothetical protein